MQVDCIPFIRLSANKMAPDPQILGNFDLLIGLCYLLEESVHIHIYLVRLSGVMSSGGKPLIRGQSNSRQNAILPFSASEDARVLWSLPEPKRKCELLGGGGDDTELYSLILQVRNHTDDRWPDQRTDADAYSDHYCLNVDGRAVGCLSMTRALHGDIFLQEYFPAVFFDNYFDKVMSAYRFRLLRPFRRTSSHSGGVSLASIMAKEAWREQIAKGVRLDLINVERQYVRYYQRLGYIYCEDADFICPVFHEPVSVLYLPADPTRESLIKDMIQNEDDLLLAKDIRRALRRRIVPLRSVG